MYALLNRMYCTLYTVLYSVQCTMTILKSIFYFRHGAWETVRHQCYYSWHHPIKRRRRRSADHGRRTPAGQHPVQLRRAGPPGADAADRDQRQPRPAGRPDRPQMWRRQSTPAVIVPEPQVLRLRRRRRWAQHAGLDRSEGRGDVDRIAAGSVVGSLWGRRGLSLLGGGGGQRTAQW